MNPKFDLSPEEMRRLGYQVVDMLVAHLETVEQKPVNAVDESSRDALERRFHHALPEQGMDLNLLLDEVHQDILEQNYHRIHPRDFAYVNAPGNPVGVLADTLVAGYNIFGGAWFSSPSAAMVELVTLDWLRQLVGMPESTGGIFTTGGSVANLTGLAVARHVKLAGDMVGSIVYLSGQTHTSVAKALRILGFHDENICKLPVDNQFRLDLNALHERVAADRAHGKRPFCVVANAGTTNTGAVDPLPEISQLCRDENLWLHIDGAYGAPAVLSEKGYALLKGIEQADSLSIDPHKWLYQPYDIGCVLVRDKRQLWETFNVHAEYLRNIIDPTLQEVNFMDYGLQMSRSFRGLKLWMSFKAFGLESYRVAITHGIELAESAEAILRQSPEWEITSPAQLAILTFRYIHESLSDQQLDELNNRISTRMIADGYAYVETTVLNERVVLRMVMINPRTTYTDVSETIRRLQSFGRELAESIE